MDKLVKYFRDIICDSVKIYYKNIRFSNSSVFEVLSALELGCPIIVLFLKGVSEG